MKLRGCARGKGVLICGAAPAQRRRRRTQHCAPLAAARQAGTRARGPGPLRRSLLAEQRQGLVLARVGSSSAAGIAARRLGSCGDHRGGLPGCCRLRRRRGPDACRQRRRSGRCRERRRRCCVSRVATTLTAGEERHVGRSTRTPTLGGTKNETTEATLTRIANGCWLDSSLRYLRQSTLLKKFTKGRNVFAFCARCSPECRASLISACAARGRAMCMR